MCGRYALAQEHEALRIRFGFVNSPPSPLRPRFNIAPTQMNPVVVQRDERKLVVMHWGLIPHWAEDKAIGNRMINARSETAPDKPSFRSSFKNKRCLVPATGFYEWQKQPGTKSKQPYFVSVKNADVFAFAGLWSLWKDPNGDDVLSYTILTTEPNDMMKSIHNRMPVILKPEEEDVWLNPALERDQLVKLLQPYPANGMTAYAVDKVVNSPYNDVPECITPMDSRK